MVVSFILTTYNSAAHLPETLRSIEAQDYPDIEVNIKDGGSTDGTLDIIREYEKSSRFCVHWDLRPDTGIYDAMNQGYALATGEIIVFFNDRLLYPEVVSEMVACIEANVGCVGAHADLVYAGEDDHVVRYWHMGAQRSLYAGWMPGHPTLFLKRAVYERYGLYKPDYRIAADYEFMIRFLKAGENRLAYLPKTIISMFYGGTSTQSAGSYLASLREGHRALKENHVKCAWVIDVRRTLRVLGQFVTH